MDFVPQEKQSKKRKKTLHAKKRTTWAFSPVTRVKQSKKVYQRRPKHGAKGTAE